jgi:RNA polymerase sigma-70 factor (ECF subfamily)
VDFDKIYSEYYSHVYKYVLSLCRNESVAEDVTSEAFLKALRNISNYKGDCEIRVWLCQIAKNAYFTYRRHIRRNEPTDDDVQDSHSFFEEAIANKSEAFAVHQILHDLGEPYKEVFSLRIFGELAFAEIAELFGKTESWARVTYHRAKTKIREGMK